MNKKNFFLIVIVLLHACVDIYEPPAIQNPNSFLVVEGIISSPSTTIKLSRTRNLAQPDTIVEVGARVYVESEDESMVIQLSEIGNGTYQNNTNLEPGENYRVKIITANDSEYISEYTALLDVPEIDTLSWEINDRQVEIYLSTQNAQNNSQYYQWTYEETWEYNARYSSVLAYEDSTIIDRPRDEQIFICWRTLPSPEILLGNTVALSENVIAQAQIKTISGDNLIRFVRGYSILVKQYALSKEAFEFWEILKQNTESLGTFFDPQPSLLLGNLRCLSNPEESVIGYVSASMATEKRMFISNKEIPLELLPEQPFICNIDTVAPIPGAIAFASERLDMVPIFRIFNEFEIFIGYAFSATPCSDCRWQGGTTTRPDFWE